MFRLAIRWQCQCRSLALLGAFAVVCAQAAAQDTTVEKIDETLTIEWRKKHIDLIRNVVTFTEGVKATFDLTEVRADRLTLYLDEDPLERAVEAAMGAATALSSMTSPNLEGMRSLNLRSRRGVAIGNVVLTDPEGTIHADRVEFDWVLKIGTAEQVQIHVAGVTLNAERIQISPSRWNLYNVDGTACGENPPFYSVRMRRLTIEPGRRAVLERPQLSILGQRLPTLPTQTLSLDNRVTGIKLPSVAQRDDRVGVTWSSGILLNEQTSLTGGFNVFPHQIPSFGLEAARSAVPPTRSTGLIAPRSELGERFSYGYFENITVRAPENEYGFLRSERDTISISSSWNQGADFGRERFRFTKPIDLAYERGGSLGNLGFVAQARAHYIRQSDEPYITRGMLQVGAGLPPLQLAPGLYALLRANAATFLNPDSASGWGRMQAGATYQPWPQLRIGGAYVFGFEAGTPAFLVDRLFSKHAMHFRTDVDLGATKFSYLAKYDLDRKIWFDREYTISQVIGCLEPYVLWRELPSDYRLGIRLRLDEFYELLQRREMRRSRTAPATRPHAP